jgi:hypothetical protein
MPVRDSLAASMGAQLLSSGVETWKPRSPSENRLQLAPSVANTIF